MKTCPNCKSTETYVADRCGYVICRKCGMTGPVAPIGNDEEAVRMWDVLPRADEARIMLLEQTLEKIHSEIGVFAKNNLLMQLHIYEGIKTALGAK